MKDPIPSKLALEIAKAIKDEYAVGTASTFCDEGEWDEATDQEVAAIIEKVLAEKGGAPVLLKYEKALQRISNFACSCQIAAMAGFGGWNTCRSRWPGQQSDWCDRCVAKAVLELPDGECPHGLIEPWGKGFVKCMNCGAIKSTEDHEHRCLDCTKVWGCGDEICREMKTKTCRDCGRNSY